MVKTDTVKPVNNEIQSHNTSLSQFHCQHFAIHMFYCRTSFGIQSIEIHAIFIIDALKTKPQNCSISARNFPFVMYNVYRLKYWCGWL